MTSIPRRRADPVLWLLAGLALVRVLWLAPRLLVPDLNLDYPFTDGDTWDWIANGLWWAGADVRFSGRPPLLPWILAALERLHALRFAPWVALAAVHAAGVAMYLALRQRAGRASAALAVLVVGASFSVQDLARDLMADSLAAALYAGACALLFSAAERPRRLLAAATLAGVAALAQPSGLLLAPALAAAFLATRDRSARLASPAPGALLTALLGALLGPSALWALWKLVRFGSGGDVLVVQWGLLRFSPAAAGTEAWFAASLLGLPGIALALAGGGVLLHRALAAPADRVQARIALLAAGAPLAFFVLLYSYPAKRLLLSFAWPAAAWIAAGLARLPRGARAAAGALAVSTALLPLGEPGHAGAAIAVWPAPPLLTTAPERDAGRGAPAIDPRRLMLVRFDLSPGSSERLSGRAFPTQGNGARFDPRPFAAARHALYVAAPDEEPRRYELQTRLGNALRKRVQWLAAPYTPCLARILGGTPSPGAPATLGTLARLETVVAPPLDGEWLLLRRPLADTTTGDAVPPTSALTRALAPANVAATRTLADAIANAPRVALVLPARPGATVCLLPLLLRTTELHVVAADDREHLAELNSLPLVAERAVAGAKVRDVIALGRPAVVVTAPPER